MYFFTIMSPADRAVAIAKYKRIVDNDSFCDYDRNKASRFLRALKAKDQRIKIYIDLSEGI